MNLEVLIPVRNPTEVFAKTIDSLAAQTDRDFSVLISDNFSTTGREHIEQALKKLGEAGIAARKIQPPSELGRVEHWNWLHHQSNADWLKPLFAGDWLEPAYISHVPKSPQRLRRAATFIQMATPTSKASRTLPGQTNGLDVSTPRRKCRTWCCATECNSARQARRLMSDRRFYRRAVMNRSLPITADSYLFCKLAARFGAAGIQEKLVHFNIHAARFSTGLSEKRWETFCENITYFFKLARDVRADGGRIPIFGFLRSLAREMRNYCFRR